MPDKKKSKKEKIRIDRNDPRQAWRYVPPKDGQKKMTNKNREYNWCKFHKSWTAHKPEDCGLRHRDEKEAKEDHVQSSITVLQQKLSLE